MTEKKPLVVKKTGNVLLINDQAYQLDERENKDGEMIFRPIDKKKLDKMVDKITERLAPELDKEMILRDALCSLPIENIERISKTLEKKRKPKVKQQRGCVGLQVGGEIIPIRE